MESTSEVFQVSVVYFQNVVVTDRLVGCQCMVCLNVVGQCNGRDRGHIGLEHISSWQSLGGNRHSHFPVSVVDVDLRDLIVI